MLGLGHLNSVTFFDSRELLLDQGESLLEVGQQST